MNRFTIRDTGSLEFYGPGLFSLYGTLSVDRTSQSVHNTANHCVAHRHLHDLAGTLYRITLLDFIVAPQDNGANIVLLKIQDQAKDIVTKIQQLACHGLIQAVDMGDAVTDFDNSSNIIDVQINIVILDLVLDDGCYFFRIHFHISLSPHY